MLRHACITEPIIGLRKIAQATLRIFPRLHLRQQHPQVALSLSARQRRRIPRMNQPQALRRYRFDRLYNDSSIPQFLVDAPHIAALLRIFENARRKRVKQQLSRVLVDVPPRNKQNLRAGFLRRGSDVPQMPRRLRREILVRIEEHDPVAPNMRKGGISCRREVVVPRKMIDPRAKHGGSIRRPVRRSCVHNDQLVYIRAQTLNGFFQMHSVVAYDITCRQAHMRLRIRCEPHFLHAVSPLFFRPNLGTLSISQMCINQNHALRDPRRHITVKKRIVPPNAGVALVPVYCRRKTRECRLVLLQTAENHPSLRVEIRQIGIADNGGVDVFQHFRIRIMQSAHGLDHLMIDFAPTTNNLQIAR